MTLRPEGWKHPAHFWDHCPMCGWMVICGRCGNNSCNGGYGELADGSDCDACPSAYEMQRKGWAATNNGETKPMIADGESAEGSRE